MKTSNEVLKFCHEFTFNNQYNIETIIELNLALNCVNIFLTISDFKHERNRIRVMGIIDDFSLKVII